MTLQTEEVSVKMGEYSPLTPPLTPPTGEKLPAVGMFISAAVLRERMMGRDSGFGRLGRRSAVELLAESKPHYVKTQRKARLLSSDEIRPLVLGHSSELLVNTDYPSLDHSDAPPPSDDPPHPDARCDTPTSITSPSRVSTPVSSWRLSEDGSRTEVLPGSRVPLSVIERNARVIKWLCGIERADVPVINPDMNSDKTPTAPT